MSVGDSAGSDDTVPENQMRPGDATEDPGERIDRRPPTLGATLAVLAAGVAVTALAVGGAPVALGLGVVALVAVAAGSFRPSPRLLTVGAAVLVAGVAAAGAFGGTPESLVVAALGAILAWDYGQFGIEVGEQLGRAADSRRLLLAHAATSLLVGVAAIVVAYGVFRAAAGGQPVTALVFLLLGVVALVAALR
jgi:hypothetical protein